MGPLTDNGATYRPRGTSASDTLSIRVEGTYDVTGTTTVRGGSVASVTITASATVENMGGRALRIGGHRSVLTVNTTDPVVVARGGPSDLKLQETYPNLARRRVTVRYAIPDSRRGEASAATLRLCDVLGREVQARELPARGGRHETQLSVSDLASGIYLLRLSAGVASKTRRRTIVREARPRFFLSSRA